MKEVQLYDAKITGIRPLTAQTSAVYFTTDTALQPGQQLFFSTDGGMHGPYSISGPGEDYMVILHDIPDAGAALFTEGGIVPFRTCNTKVPFDEQATHHFFFGNELATGLFKSYKELAEARDHEYFGITEMTDGDAACMHALHLMLEHVPATPDAPAANAIQWMEEMHPLCWNTWKDATFYLSGNEISTCAFKQYLLHKGVSVHKIRC